MFIVKYNSEVKGISLIYFITELFGKLMSHRLSIKIIHEEPEWFILRVNHRYLPFVRAAVALYGKPGDLYTLAVSGTVRGLIHRLEPRIECRKYMDSFVKAYSEYKRKEYSLRNTRAALNH
jgi:RNase P/RNase MRP subunit POP5